MVAATSVLGSALTHEEAGITAVVSGALSPIIGSMSPIIFVLFIALATVMITNFASNTVTVTLMYSISLPLVYGGAISGVDPAALTCVIGACACVACATPALHGPRRHCGRVRMAEYGYDAQIWALVVRHSGRDLCGGGLPDRRGHHVTEGKESCLWNDSLMLLWSAAVPPVLQPL